MSQRERTERLLPLAMQASYGFDAVAGHQLRPISLKVKHRADNAEK